MTTETICMNKGYKAGGWDNVISLAGYVARYGRKTNYRYAHEENNLVSLAGCQVINLAERR